MLSMHRDFAASHLRNQVNRLRGILNNIGKKTDCDYARHSLKEIEAGLRQIRKICANN